MSDHKFEKLKSMYRYSMPLHWVLDRIEYGEYNQITKFDLLNAKDSLDKLESIRFPPKESDN